VYDPANGEIGDICNAMEVMFAGTDGNLYTVQAGFSNGANDCIASRTILPPVANNQNVTSRQGTLIAIALSGLDTNVCPRTITFNVSASPSHGMLSGTAPSLTYTPDPTYFGPDSFQFIVYNGLLNSSPATVGITLVSASISVAQLPDRNVRIAFAATPRTSFEVQATDLVSNPSPWVTLLITNSGTNMILGFDDLDATNHQRRYYRTATP
jgi:hypothetical protein